MIIRVGCDRGPAENSNETTGNSLDGEMRVDVPTDEFTSEAKEVLPAIRPLEINEAVRLTLYGTFVFHLFLRP